MLLFKAENVKKDAQICKEVAGFHRRYEVLERKIFYFSPSPSLWGGKIFSKKKNPQETGDFFRGIDARIQSSSSSSGKSI